MLFGKIYIKFYDNVCVNLAELYKSNKYIKSLEYIKK